MSFDPDNKQTKRRGKVTRISKITPYEAKQEALYMLRTGQLGFQAKLRCVINLLSTAGVMLEEQVIELGGAKLRTLQRYRKKGYLDLLTTPDKLASLLGDKTRVLALGPIGIALAELRVGLVPTGYLDANEDRITHDVLVNLVYYHIYRAASEAGYKAILKSKYEATVHDNKGRPILEPDAMIILRRRDTEVSKFVVEYHNEDFGSRVIEKVDKYEEVFRSGYWKKAWQTETMPQVLVVATHRAVGIAYKRDIEGRQLGRGVRCSYLAKPLQSFLNLDSPLIWQSFNTNTRVHLLDS